MNCTTCRYELSQCLDGRLPSGRRAIVMQHVTTCAVCSTFWTDLQAAQSLTLRLSKMRVGEGFRERLWERIGAGEGTPEAVFHEPVPLLTKIRYVVTGAAAAAVALLAVTWARGDHDASLGGLVAKIDRHGETPSSPTILANADNPGMQIDQSPLISSARPFTCGLLAVEAAKQLEQRLATANLGIRRLDEHTGGGESAVKQVLADADEFCVFGEVLLDLRDHKRLVFTDSEVDADLRLAVTLLRQSQQRVRNLETVRSLVAPALQSSRLANVSRTFALKPTIDPSEEMEVLMRLITMRHDVFPKLFIVFGNDEVAREIDPFGTGNVFVMRDQCGPSWVAPRSEVEAGDGRLRILRSRVGTAPGRPDIEVKILTSRQKNGAVK